jgi:hypothetical protein
MEQLETFLQPLENDDFPCKPSTWIENPKDRRLRLPKYTKLASVANGQKTR